MVGTINRGRSWTNISPSLTPHSPARRAMGNEWQPIEAAGAAIRAQFEDMFATIALLKGALADQIAKCRSCCGHGYYILPDNTRKKCGDCSLAREVLKRCEPPK